MGRSKKRPRRSQGGSSSSQLGSTDRAMLPNNGEPIMQADMMQTLLQTMVSVQRSMESRMVSMQQSMESMESRMVSMQQSMESRMVSMQQWMESIQTEVAPLASELREVNRVNDELRKDLDGVKERLEKTTKEVEGLKQSRSQPNQTEQRMVLADPPMNTPLYKFKFTSNVNYKVYTRTKIGTDKNDSIEVVLLRDGEQLEPGDPFSSISAQLFLLEGDFKGVEDEGWDEGYFVSKIITLGSGKSETDMDIEDKSILTFQLTNGIFSLSDLQIKNNSNRKDIRLGVRAATITKERILEGISNAFRVLERKTKEYAKSKTPSLTDPICRLERVRKGSEAVETLRRRGIETVGRLLTWYNVDEDGLKKILRDECHYRDTDITRILTHALSCKIEGELLCYTENDKKLFAIPGEFIIAGMEYSNNVYRPFAELTKSEQDEAKTWLSNALQAKTQCYAGYKMEDGLLKFTEASSSQQNSFSNPQSTVDNMQMVHGCGTSVEIGQSSNPFPNGGPFFSTIEGLILQDVEEGFVLARFPEPDEPELVADDCEYDIDDNQQGEETDYPDDTFVDAVFRDFDDEFY